MNTLSLLPVAVCASVHAASIHAACIHAVREVLRGLPFLAHVPEPVFDALLERGTLLGGLGRAHPSLHTCLRAAHVALQSERVLDAPLELAAGWVGGWVGGFGRADAAVHAATVAPCRDVPELSRWLRCDRP